MTRMLEATTPDLDAVKQRQQQAWASGDFAAVAARILLVAELLCDTADLHAGWRVLDVATGTGNAAIAAARLGCTAVGIDYEPALLEQGRRRAAAEGLEVELLEGDAESLPFPDASFDAVTSVFGSMWQLRGLSFASSAVRLRGDHSEKEEAMKYMLLIQQGATPTPPSDEWERLSEDEQNAVYGAYKAINETPGVTPGDWLQPPEAATTVRVQDGKTLTTDGPFVAIKEALGGYLLFEADDLDAAIELAARIPAARMGGAVEVRPLVEY